MTRSMGSGVRSIRGRLGAGTVSVALIAVMMAVAAPPARAAFQGFDPPILAPPALNGATAGVTVSLRFSLGGDQGLDVIAAGFPTVEWIDCTSKVRIANTGVVAAQGTLTYDAGTGHYRYAWRTARAWGGTCQRFTLGLTDGTSHPALFRFARSTNTNLLANPGFEKGTGTTPTAWERAYYLDTSTLTREIGAGRGGSAAGTISSPTANDASWIQTVQVLPNTLYRFSGWIRTTDVAHNTEPVDAGATLSRSGTFDHTSGVFGTTDWTWVSFGLNSGAEATLTLSARLGYTAGVTTGTARFDDLRLEEVRPVYPPPSWKILVLIYGKTDVTIQRDGVTRHVVGTTPLAQRDAAAAAARAFVRTDIPKLDSGLMTPTVTVRFPGTLRKLDPIGGGFWPSPQNTAAARDPAFDSVIVIWESDVVDVATGEGIWIGFSAGLATQMGTGQTYSTMIVDAATEYGHRNVFKHEWGHSILFFLEAAGMAPRPFVTNEPPTGYYVHCPTGTVYDWRDETLADPIPNSIYNNDSGFTHDYYSGETALATNPTACLGGTRRAWAYGGPVRVTGTAPAA